MNNKNLYKRNIKINYLFTMLFSMDLTRGLWLIYLFSKGMSLGQIGILVNKMDTLDYNEEKFNKVKEEVGTLLKSLGYKLEEVPFIPISALKGDNVAKKSENMDWYQQWLGYF